VPTAITGTVVATASSGTTTATTGTPTTGTVSAVTTVPSSAKVDENASRDRRRLSYGRTFASRPTRLSVRGGWERKSTRSEGTSLVRCLA
jgi:hypothetical protein